MDLENKCTKPSALERERALLVSQRVDLLQEQHHGDYLGIRVWIEQIRVGSRILGYGRVCVSVFVCVCVLLSLSLSLPLFV